jgi:DNA helicase II / ATP-dependent DNA helicase PcrA
MLSPNNLAIIAGAGSRKTESIIEMALSDSPGKTLVTTYANGNLDQIVRRVYGKAGHIPSNVNIVSWYTFLLRQCARPYQHYLLGDAPLIRSINFKRPKPWMVSRSRPLQHYLDKANNIYSEGLSDFICRIDQASNGKVINRLSSLYERIVIDEAQDLSGYDLDLLARLFVSPIEIVMVGDPRQCTYVTNQVNRNRRFRRTGLGAWLQKHEEQCRIEERVENHRCNQAICDYADALYPDFPSTKSQNFEVTGHDGVFEITRPEVASYLREYQPVILRDSIVSNTMEYPATNFGVAKGCTYDRVLIFPTNPMKQYIRSHDLSSLRPLAVTRLYIAVTRARHSVTFVM